MINEQKKIIEAQEHEIQTVVENLESQQKEKQMEQMFDNERAKWDQEKNQIRKEIQKRD